MRRGFDYEDPQSLKYNLRMARYTGCTGKVSFEKDSNDRSFNGIFIQQYTLNEETDDFEIVTIGTYNPLSINMFSFGEF